MRVQIDGQTVEVPDDATDEEINSLFPAGGTAPTGERSTLGRFAHYAGLASRAAAEGVSGAVTGLPTLAVDAGVNAAYGAKKLAAKAGLAEAPDPKNYYGPNPENSYFPTTAGMAAATGKGLDALGYAKPENDAEAAATGVGGAVAGALTGSGIGGAMARAPGAFGAVGRLMAQEPGLQATMAGGGAAVSTGVNALDEGRDLPEWAAPAIGAGASMLGGGAFSAARAATGYIPGVGRVGTNVPDTHMRIAREMVQNRATDRGAAVRGLTAATEREADPAFTAPGYQFLNYEAARDPGVASMKQAFQDYSAANGAPIVARTQENNVALTRAWRGAGADADGAEALRDQARANAGTRLEEMGLTRQGEHEPVSVAPLLRQLSRESSPLAEGSSDASRSVSRDVRRMVRQASYRIEEDTGRVRADGTPITRRRTVIDPERIQSVRTDLSESLGAANPNVAYPVPAAARARGTSGVNLGRLDDLIASRAPEYPGYMAGQRALRGEADQRSFLDAQMQAVAKKPDLDTGARQFDTSALSQLDNLGKRGRTVAGAPPRMSIGKLSPARQAFVRDQAELGGLADYSNTRGMAGSGSPTVRRGQVDQEVMTRIQASRAPGERLLGIAARGGGMALNYLPIVGPKLNAGLRAAGSGINQAAGIGARNAQEAVGEILSRFATDRGLATDLLTGPTLPARGIGISARRQAGREAGFGVQSFLSGQRDMEERRKRYR